MYESSLTHAYIIFYIHYSLLTQMKTFLHHHSEPKTKELQCKVVFYITASVDGKHNCHRPHTDTVRLSMKKEDLNSDAINNRLKEKLQKDITFYQTEYKPPNTADFKEYIFQRLDVEVESIQVHKKNRLVNLFPHMDSYNLV